MTHTDVMGSDVALIMTRVMTRDPPERGSNSGIGQEKQTAEGSLALAPEARVAMRDERAREV
ncbi:MAG: hypothetical protein Q6K80_07685 [Thermostichus sp. DG_1_6_bins_120]